MNSYSHDLREKIVEAVSGRSMAKSAAARTFGVSLSSVKRYVAMAREGVPLAPRKEETRLEAQARRESQEAAVGRSRRTSLRHPLAEARILEGTHQHLGEQLDSGSHLP